MNFGDLSPCQRTAAEATEHMVLVTGGAGTGKTTVALWAARKHLERDNGTSAERVLFVTFSRTAVSQIASRSRAVMTGIGHRIEIQTFHSLAFRLLRAFGRYAGRGTNAIEMESIARSKLLGRDRRRLSYDDLLPGAIELLESPAIAQLASRRWTLVICDEFQDTSDEQWRLLELLAASSRLLVLADPNQMIYGFLDTVGARRLAATRDAVDRVIALEEASHRDPSGVVPAMAAAIRRREFEHPAIRAALDSKRLRIRRSTDDEAPDIVASEIHHHRAQQRRSIGMYETTKAAVAQLGAELSELGLDYTLVGLPEAHGEALLSMACIAGFGLGAVDWTEVELQLGVFVTSVSRGDTAPDLARQLAGAPGMRPVLRERLDSLRRALQGATDDDDLIRLAVETFPALRIVGGGAAWTRAGVTFGAAARRALRTRLPDADRADALVAACRQLHLESIITTDSPLISPIQLMNFHQTKGREADAVILLYREGGWVTSRDAREPFASESRVLYVALTRARDAVTILIPPFPHPLVAPLAGFVS